MVESIVNDIVVFAFIKRVWYHASCNVNAHHKASRVINTTV